MRVLAFDTCFAACSVAVVDVRANSDNPGTALASMFEEMERGHADRLLPMVQEVMQHAAVSFADLDGIATAYGPGTFTGVRIAVAAARAMSLATELPVYGFSSLALVAAKARHLMGTQNEDRIIAATMDARRDEIYVQLFQNPKYTPLTKPQVLSPLNAAMLSREPMIGVGSGAAALSEAARTRGLTVDAAHIDLQPDAGFSYCVHMELLESLAPLYLRPPDAKPQTGKSVPRI